MFDCAKWSIERERVDNSSFIIEIETKLWFKCANAVDQKGVYCAQAQHIQLQCNSRCHLAYVCFIGKTNVKMNDIILACIHINRQSIFKQSMAVVIGILQNGKLKDDTVKSIGPIVENGKLMGHSNGMHSPN